MLSLTPSKAREFLTCPQLFKLKHIDRRGHWAVTPALAFGCSLHAVLEHLHNPARDPALPFDLEHTLRCHWRPEAYADGHESDVYFAQGLDALGRYTEALPAGKQILGTEVYLSRAVRLGAARFQLGCKADCISLRADGVLEVLDYKTNAAGKVPTAEWLARDIPTFIYYVLARIVYTAHTRVVVAQLNLLSLAKVEVAYDTALLAANKQALVNLAGDLAAGSYNPRPCEACAWCPVVSYCPASGVEVNLDCLI